MPEMLQYCGHRFVVFRRAEKICDTIKTYGSRRIRATVLLEDLRCDGSGHDGCQADCRLFWKEAWLRRIDSMEPLSSTNTNGNTSSSLADILSRFTKQFRDMEGHAIGTYRCQATELYRASTPLSVWDPRPYIKEFACGNVTFGRFLRISARAFIMEPLRKFGFIPTIPLPGTLSVPKPDDALDLQPGDWVKVKKKEEIASTLTPDGRDRGLWVDREMLPYCEGTYQVKQRVKRFIDDRTGRMIEFKKECITLKGVVCSGELSLHRYFCPRGIVPYWREKWLFRVHHETSESQQMDSKGGQ